MTQATLIIMQINILRISLILLIPFLSESFIK